MKRLAVTLWLACVLSAPTLAQGQDVLYLQDGRERVGRLVAATAADVTFWVNGESEPVTVPRDEVQRVDLTRARAGAAARTVADLNDALLERLLEHQPGKLAFPDSGYVTLYQIYDYTFDPDGTYVLRERHIEQVLQERGKGRANVARFYKKGEESLAIDFARTIDPAGDVTPISDAAVDMSSAYAMMPEYEKLQQVKFAMKQVRLGSVLDYQVSKTRQTRLLDPFYASMLLRDEEPILEAEYRFDVPVGMDLVIRKDRWGDNVEYTREEQGDRVIHRIVARRCERVVPEPMMPPGPDIHPRLTVSQDWTWERIGRAYSKLLRPRLEATPAIREKVAEVTAGAATPAQRAQQVFQYFTEAFTHQWVPPGNYSYEPRPPAETFANRAGNSVDKAALLVAMMRAADVPAALVLAKPQGAGHLLDDVPNIRQFSDALVAVTVGGKRVFLPLYDESVRFGQMPARYQGTRGLLVDASGATLVEIPLNPPEDEMVAATYRIRVTPGGDLMVRKEETYYGNEEIARRNMWKDMKQEELRRSLELGLRSIHAQARLDDYAIENLHDVTQPLRFTQTYTLLDYAERAGGELLAFQLPEVEYGAAEVGKPTREFPLDWSSRAKATKQMTFAVPPGWIVYHAGDDSACECEPIAFEASFDATGGEIVYADTFVRTEVEAPQTAYAEYKACVEQRARLSKEWIVLERKSEHAAAPDAASPGVP